MYKIKILIRPTQICSLKLILVLTLCFDFHSVSIGLGTPLPFSEFLNKSVNEGPLFFFFFSRQKSGSGQLGQKFLTNPSTQKEGK